MSIWLVVLRKELVDAMRDRRALMTLLIFPFLGPAMIYFMLNSMLDISADIQDVVLPVVGVDYAPDLIDYLEQNGIEIKSLDIASSELTLEQSVFDEVKVSIEERVYDFVLIIPSDFEQKLSESRPANLEFHIESSRTAALPKVSRVEQLISGWEQETIMLRMIARGINNQVLNPVNLQRIDVASAQARAQRILGMVPLFVMMAAFVSGMGLAVDATAGERERKSLEPLLVNPVQRSSIVIGKWMAATFFATLGLLLVLCLILFSLSKIPLEQLGLNFSIGHFEILAILATTLPMAFFATSLQLFVGIFTKSFKDAQSYLSLIILLPTAPMLFNMFNTQSRELWMNFVPMLGQHMLMEDVLSGRTPPILDFVLAGLTLVVFAFIFVYGATALFKRERIIFS